MSNREQLVQMAQSVPEEQAIFAMHLLKSYLDALEEMRDDAFCLALNERYLENPDKGEGVPIEELAVRLGVTLT